jgi:hypothetical protein
LLKNKNQDLHYPSPPVKDNNGRETLVFYVEKSAKLRNYSDIPDPADEPAEALDAGVVLFHCKC